MAKRKPDWEFYMAGRGTPPAGTPGWGARPGDQRPHWLELVQMVINLLALAGVLGTVAVFVWVGTTAGVVAAVTEFAVAVLAVGLNRSRRK